MHYAERDILIGEEIVSDYSNFEDSEDKDNILADFADRYQLVDEVDPRDKK